MDVELFSLNEDIKDRDYVLAVYYIHVNSCDDIIKKAGAMAIGQTVGTWITVPGLSADEESRHVGRVVNVISVPPYELSSQVTSDYRDYILHIAYPTVNLGSGFPLLLTTLLGNDASTSAQVKLVDLIFPETFAVSLGGPKFGLPGLRKLFPEKSFPLTMNMIKPCTGISPRQGAEIFYKTALGGIDIIKDDELLGNTSFSSIADRVREYNRAGAAAYEVTGRRCMYICNITDDVCRLEDNLKAAVDAGAEAVMMSYSALGYSAFSWIAGKSPVPVLGHYAVSGAFSEGLNSGMSSHLAMGKLPRLAGADMCMINTPYGGYPLEYSQYIKTFLNLSLPFYSIKPTMPVVGGGVHPGMVKKLIADLGSDIVIAAGGAVQGHPMGAAAGAKAMRDAIDAVTSGMELSEAAKASPELEKALELWNK